jgi:peptide/nickel transport system ATP-binding protein
MTSAPVLSVENYSLDYVGRTGAVRVLQDVNLAITKGEVLGLVGESGSGKTSLAYAIMRYLPPNAREPGGFIRLLGEDLRTKTTAEIDSIRGRRISMVFQDPSTSLNPTLTLGEQIGEVLVRHKGLSQRGAYEQGKALLHKVGLKDPSAMMRRYPHEASGGEKQRVIIASAFAAEPECILFDEPTTALDVITSSQIIELFRELQAETGVASLYISHDLALVSRIADRVAVIHRGRIVEEDPAAEVFRSPREAYTKALIASVPRPDRRLVTGEPPAKAIPLLAADQVTVRYGRSSFIDSILRRPAAGTIGAREISLDVKPSEIVGIVGESGSGKSTLARALVGLNPFEGTIRFGERRVVSAADMDRDYRRSIQIIFQHPDSSLNPRQTIGDILLRPLRLYDVKDGESEKDMVAKLLDEVQLPADFAKRYPHQLSGGQKQRVAIARAFASRPNLVICDEITSSLDVSVQAQIIELLLSLRERFGTAYFFITHDLNLVRQIAHRIAVMYRGNLVEVADVDTLARGPSHPYTRALLDAVPTPVG